MHVPPQPRQQRLSTIHQLMDDVHAALIDYLKRSVLTPSVLETVVSAIRDEMAEPVATMQENGLAAMKETFERRA